MSNFTYIKVESMEEDCCTQYDIVMTGCIAGVFEFPLTVLWNTSFYKPKKFARVGLPCPKVYDS